MSAAAPAQPAGAAPRVLTALCFDFGLARIGVAVGNSLSRDASALSVIRATNDEARFAAIEPLIRQWQPAQLVVGRPAHDDGGEHPMCARCERFARQLHGRFRLPVALVDERYSSVDARAEMRAETRAEMRDETRAGLRADPRAGRQASNSGRRGRREPIGDDDAQAAAIILRQYWSQTTDRQNTD